MATTRTTRRARPEQVAQGVEREEYDPSYIARELSTFTWSHAYAWDIDRVSSARNAHLEGDLSQSGALAIHMRKDSAIFSALQQRCAPFRGLSSQFLAPRRAGSTEWVEDGRALPGRMQALAREVYDLRTGSGLSTALLSEIVEQVAVCGLCVTRNRWVAREDGRAVELRPEVWPIEAVVWSPLTKLQARTTTGMEPIVHGDGSWTVFAQHEAFPWLWGALVPLSFCWIDRAFGVRDRRNQSQSNGSGKPIGILPEGVKIKSAEGAAAIALMKALHKPLSGGVAPHGMEVKWLESTSQAWQIYREIVAGNDRDIPRILLGQDGTTVATGGNYIKDGLLMGVRNDLIEGDLSCLERGLYQGVFRPFAWINGGVADAASRLVWQMPDPDRDQRITSYGTRSAAYAADLLARQSAGGVVDQVLADRLASRYEVEPMTMEAEPPEPAEPAAEPADPAAEPADPAAEPVDPGSTPEAKPAES